MLYPFLVPSRTYVIDQLIDWSAVPEDPIFQLTFPQRGMLAPEHFERVARALREEWPAAEFNALVAEVRHALNPHPAGQLEHNIPQLNGERVEGIQHKYRETVLFFPQLRPGLPQLLHLLLPLGPVRRRQGPENRRQGVEPAV